MLVTAVGSFCQDPTPELTPGPSQDIAFLSLALVVGNSGLVLYAYIYSQVGNYCFWSVRVIDQVYFLHVQNTCLFSEALFTFISLRSLE